MADGTDIATGLTVDNCDKEPIHIPGHIQPFGALLACPLTLNAIDYVSANLADIIGIEAQSVLGKPLGEVLPKEALHDLRNILSYSTSKTQRERVGRYELDGSAFEVYAHRSGEDRGIIEIEKPVDLVESGERSPAEQARLFLARAGAEPSIERMLKVGAFGLRELTGYDRVKAYRYALDGSGEVLSEARGPDIDSFLGLRYPAWDVPAQARALQVKNPLRLLSDVGQDPVPVLRRDDNLPPLDMSLSHLRGVSPIHVEYLKNMGVGATLTIGIVVDGRLWGMFACHHMSPRVISSDTRIAAELFGQMISLLIKEKTENEHAAKRVRAAAAKQRILAETDAAKDMIHAFPDIATICRELITCDGVAVVREDKLQTSGSVPPEKVIRHIAERMKEEEDLIDVTEAMVGDFWIDADDACDSAGCMLLRATAAYPLQFMFFRDEVTKKVTWAGDPKKEMGHGPFGPRITPRGSFNAFMEEQKGQSEAWTEFDHTSAKEIQTLLTQLTARGERQNLVRHKDLLNHQRQQELMIAELNHRVKNILALIRSLSRQAKASSASLESYALALEQRIAALAAAHDLAVSESMQGVSLRGILDTELVPYMNDDEVQVILSGPVVGLRADVAPMIALVFHEVITNAAKYGALSTTDGIVKVKWSVSDEGLSFSWREIGGPEVSPPSRHGFGRSLIEKAIPYEFDGTVDLDYDPAGLRFSFTLPAENLVDLKEEKSVKLAGSVGEIIRVASKKRVLLVEDNLVLAMDMVESLSRLGAETIETASTVDAAMRELDRGDYDFAILDMNLRGKVSFEIAQKLRGQNIPFLFVTGYGSNMSLPPELAAATVLTKPVDDGSLSQGIGKILRAQEEV
ncbi:HWE histidine kinase domain-containing protein [Parvularcula maris]|uniref:histidine kinase n=1 Tax=Parvularcula maris TaxID=2965077 RepID=A0A9X2RJA2_9PROT|nr:HWE histidine kinase domain-containing protein [Parvularcula maris]MCQ8184473.1 GAF domain-containing protein [Parvularcula maris]